MSMKGFVRRRVREPLLLKDAERVAQAYTPAQRARITELSDAARRRESAALQLREDASTAGAVELHRQATAMSITALLVARGEHGLEGVLEPPEAWAQLSSLLDAGALAEPPEELSVARPLLAESDVLAVDRLPPAAARDARDAAEATTRWLRGCYESRTPRQLKLQRILRVGAVAAALGLLLTAGVARALAPKDIALNKPVTASGRFRGTPTASHVIDGVKDGTLGVHTSLGDDPWVEIDLQAPYAINKVVVVNRGDGYFDRILPLALQLSTDGKHFDEVALRKTHFTDTDPWVVKLPGKVGRYVRLQVKKKRAYLWASEIEVYGSKK